MASKAKAADPDQVIKFRTEELLKSKALKNYQKDFAKALLTKPKYSMEEAKEVLDQFFGKENK